MGELIDVSANGNVKKFSPDKGYGFIAGDNGAEYFFRKSDLLDEKIAVGDFVTFQPGDNAKGNVAKQVNSVSLAEFELPRKIYFENKIPSEYKILERSFHRFSSYGVDGRIVGRKNATKNRLKVYARAFGANALLNINYIEGEEEHTDDTIIYDDDGNIDYIIIDTYYLTTHLFFANLARIGKRATGETKKTRLHTLWQSFCCRISKETSGETKKDLNLLHQVPLNMLIKETKKHLYEKRGYDLIRFIALFVVLVLIFNSLPVMPSALAFAIFLVVAFVIAKFICPNLKEAL